MKIKNFYKLITKRRISALLSLSVLIVLSLGGPVAAQTVTQGYSYEGPIQRGMVVSLKAEDTNQIELATLANGDRAHGVVVDPNDAPVTISGENQKVFVATVGRYDMLISDQNGQIQQGDYIALSSIAGVGMKADELLNVSVGKALSNFDGQSGVVSSVELKDDQGGNQKVNVGRIQVDIGIGANPLARPQSSDLPGYLQKAAEAIADKPVTSVRVYLGLVVLAVTGTVAGALLYSGVKSSLISIGRNPLSKKSIIRGMIQIIITSILILIVGVFGVYLLIKL